MHIKKFNELFESKNNQEAVLKLRPFLEESVIEYVRQHSPDSIINDRYILCYHGTKYKNYQNILKTNRFNSGTFFALDFETAEKYSMMVTGIKEKNVVMQSTIYAGSLTIVGGYLTLNEDVYFGNSVYEPKNFKK